MENIKSLPITAAGGTHTIELAQPFIDTYVVVNDTNPLTLAGNWVFNFNGDAIEGTSFQIIFGQVAYGASSSLNVNGIGIGAAQALLGRTMVWAYRNGAWTYRFTTSVDDTSNFNGNVLIDYSLSLSKLSKSSPGNFLQFNSSGIVTSTAMTGVIAISSSGATTFNGSPISDTHIALSAAIQRIKIAAGTVAHVLYNDDTTGLMTSEAYLATKRGGLGNTFAAATGFLKFDAGVAIAEAFTDIRERHVSFDSDSLGNYYITFPVDVTVTNIEVRVEKEITDSGNGELTLMDDGGNLMVGSGLTAGVLSVTTGSLTGIGFTSTLTENNVFAAGEKMRIVSDKASGGGTVNAEVTYTRNS